MLTVSALASKWTLPSHFLFEGSVTKDRGAKNDWVSRRICDATRSQKSFGVSASHLSYFQDFSDPGPTKIQSPGRKLRSGKLPERAV